MPIGGNNDTFTITGAKLKVDQGVQVAGSVVYTANATGFGGVTAQIDGNNTLNITSGKLAGVANVAHATAATITTITHTNVINNTTIHIALKNTSSNKGDFITIGTFANDNTIKVNYTDEYSIGPGETGMITLRKVNGVLSVFIREMYSSTATDFDNKPFYIKSGINYKYPLYKTTGGNTNSVNINGVTYYEPSGGHTTKTRPPKGLPENVVPPSASSFKIGNNGAMTTLEYSVLGVSSNYDYASITDSNNVTHARFILTDGEAGGTFTESGASSGDSYKLYIEKTDTTLSDTVTATSTTLSSPFAVFHHGSFASGGDPYSHGSVTAAATAGYFYSDTATGTYPLGTLDETPTFYQETALGGDGSGKTMYKFTFHALTSVDVLMVAGGGGGGGDMAGGGGAGGYLETKNTTISSGQKEIVVGGGGIGGAYTSTESYRSRGRNGAHTSLTGFTTAIGGGGGATGHNNSDDKPGGNGGSGGGGSGGRQSGGQYGETPGTGTSGQGYDGADSGVTWYPGGGGGASQKGYGHNGSGGTNHQPHGGDGKQCTITGFTSYWFAGGGGGNGVSSATGHGGKGGGGGGAGHGQTHGTGDTNGLTNGGNGDDGTTSDTQEPPSDRAGGDGGKHTGGGGGGGDHHVSHWGGNGGSGIVIIRTGDPVTTGKDIAKVKDIVIDPENGSNVLISTQGTGISTVKYSIDGGSEVSTPVSQLSVAHGITPTETKTILAYALDASNARLGIKLSKSILAVYGYETITLETKSGSQTIIYVDNGTTEVTNTYKSGGGNTWNGGWILKTGYTAPVTFEYKASASSGDDGNSYKQIGISDSITETHGSGSSDFDIYHYAYFQSQTNFGGQDITDGSASHAWNSTDTFYIVYKTTGTVEWWQAGTKINSWAWGGSKTVYLSSTFWKQGNGSDNGSFKNIRVRRRQWDGTKYIN